MWNNIKNSGKDGEEWDILKARINPINKIEKHNNPNNPYDYKVSKRIGDKNTEYREVKLPTAKLTENEKKFQDTHSRNYIVRRVSRNNPVHIVRNIGRKIDDLID